jgi:hypothetical protein
VDNTAPPLSTGDGTLRLTYHEIAVRIGGTVDGAHQLVRRKQWRRIMPNRRGAAVVVEVPEDALADESWRQDRAPRTVDRAPPPSIAQEVIAAKDAHIGLLTDQLAKAEMRVEAAEARAAKAESRIDAVLAMIAALAQRYQDPPQAPQVPQEGVRAGDGGAPPAVDDDLRRRLLAAEDEIAVALAVEREERRAAAERALVAQTGEGAAQPASPEDPPAAAVGAARGVAMLAAAAVAELSRGA